MLKTHPSKVRNTLLIPVLAAAPFLNSLPGQDENLGDTAIYELSPFVVASNNTGYLETNAVSGTSLKMAIRDIPMSLEVINNEFITDQQATDLKEALSYSAGVFTQSYADGSGANIGGSVERSPSSVSSVNNASTNTVSIRGFAVPTQQRFGFRIGGVAVGEGFSVVLGGLTDTVNTERLEVVRGPAALLYGVNVLSGVVNVLPKRPLGEFSGNALVGVGSRGFLRAELDITGPIIKNKLHYRIMTAQEERDNPRTFNHDRKQYYAGQLEYIFSKKLQVLVEAQYGDLHRNGVDSAFFTDNLSGGNIADNPVNTLNFRNRYNEYVSYGKEDYSSLFIRDDSDPFDIYYLPKTKVYGDNPVPLEYVGHEYRVSGPDTYFDRKEYNLMALVTMQPIKNLNLELGGYFTHLEEENFGVEMSVFTNRESAINGNPSDKRPYPAFFSTNPNKANIWVRNPEVNAILGGYPFGGSGLTYGLDEAVGFTLTENDIVDVPGTLPANQGQITTAGLGEIFIVPHNERRASNPGTDWNTWNTKFARYYWTKRPTESDSLQLRARASYSLETGFPFLGEKSVKHTFIGGFQYAKDDLQIVSGNPDIDDVYTPGQYYNLAPEGIIDVSLGRLGEDPYILRDSVFDLTPIRYNGEPIAISGRLNVSTPKMGLPLTQYVDDLATEPGEIKGWNIARSGWRDVTVEQDGIYAIYQAQFLNDKATFYTGVRRDSYQVREVEQLRALAGTPSVDPVRNAALTDIYYGSTTYTTLPYLLGDGSQPYTPDRWISDLPEELNREIQKEIDLFREGFSENGTGENLFDKPQSYTTASIGLSYRIIDPLSIYAMYSEGVFPNQGQRDGLDNPVPAEQTSNEELGIKFELFDGRISGNFAIYRISRENATWQFNAAPSPRQWVGGANGISSESVITDREFRYFDAQSAMSGNGPEAQVIYDSYPKVTPETYQRYSYGVHESFFRAAWAETFGEPAPDTLNDAILATYGLGFVGTIDQGVNGKYENAGQTRPYYYVDVRRDLVAGKHVDAQGRDLGLMVKQAFDNALLDKDFDGRGLFWPENGGRAAAFGAGNNPSNKTGDLVTFSDETVGFDGQIFFRVTDGYQIIFSYSYQKRQVVGNGFNLAPLIDPVSGEQIPGTKYDEWVFVLGEENFTDPTDPTTFTGAGINGLDLSFVPSVNLSLWNKYDFTEGPLAGLGIGLGARFLGSSETSLPIGGTGLAENRYPTPPTKERLSLDASLSYKWRMFNMTWKLALKVDNLLNQRWYQNDVVYDNIIDGINFPEERRSLVILAPRSYRLSLSMRF